MAKGATIASLVRSASRNEGEFIATSQQVLDEEDLERVAEFFDRLNIPRSVGTDVYDAPLTDFEVVPERIGTYAQERAISDGLQKFLDRHERKIKWHGTHPSMEGSENVVLLLRCAMMATHLRLTRLQLLLRVKDELTPEEWAIARELMNRAYLSFRNFMDLLSGLWIDAVLATVSHDDLAEKLGMFYEIIDQHILVLEEHRHRIEERRQELTVIPEGFPPVKPPVYFGGDLLGRGPWTQYWENLGARAHHFRESLG